MILEQTILNYLLVNDQYCRAVLPFLKEEYFGDAVTRNIFKITKEYIDKYNKAPTKVALLVKVDSIQVNGDVYKELNGFVTNFDENFKADYDWAINETETFCQDKAILNGIRQAVKIIDNDGQLDKGSIPKILSDALAVSFDTNIGHDFLESFENRYEFYHRKEERLQFDLDLLNKITGGGLPRKTFNVLLGGTGTGKTLFMTHFAAANLLEGKNVLYITLEMAEERIAERIDANLMNLTIDEVQNLPKEAYFSKADRLRNKVKGKLVIKEYPTTQAGSAHFRHLIQELRLKKNFVPDIVYVDYINICSSSRMKLGASVNSYTYIKSIAEELRGLSVEFNIPLVTATQTNRDGFNSSDVDLTNVSESFGVPATADLMFAIVRTEELDALNQVMIIQLKNRYNDLTKYKRFVLGIDRSKMKLYDADDPTGDLMGNENKSVMDNSKFGQRLNEEKRDFSGLKL